MRKKLEYPPPPPWVLIFVPFLTFIHLNSIIVMGEWGGELWHNFYKPENKKSSNRVSTG